MRSIGDKAALRFERVLELIEHPVEARRKEGDLVAAPTFREPPAEVARATDFIGGASNIFQRLEGAARDKP